MAQINGMFLSFSSINYGDNGVFQLSGVDTIKMDILSHLYTDKDERIMMPGWGTIIPRVPFEPLTMELLEEIYDDVVRVVEYDPRVRLESVFVTPYHDIHTIIVEVIFTVIQTSQIDNLFMVLDMGNDAL